MWYKATNPMKNVKIAATDQLPRSGALFFSGMSKGLSLEGVNSTREQWQERRVTK